MDLMGAYIPIDRRHALAKGVDLPDRTEGAALFADISGFTPLTEALANEMGARRGAEELTQQLNTVYSALIDEVHNFHGSVIGFAGDAITCWFDKDNGLRAVSSALAMQAAMQQFLEIKTPGGNKVELAIKTAVTTGSVRRFLIGDPLIQKIDVLAGDTLARMAAAEHMAERGDVVVTYEVVEKLKNHLVLGDERLDEEGERYAVVQDLITPITLPPWPKLPPDALSEAQMEAWLLPPVYDRLQTGQDTFLAELRPAVTIFLRFGGIDYDEDDEAGEKLNRYVSWVQNILNKHEGYLLQLIMGDKGSYLYAAFGAPISHGDDAARAVAAALELIETPPDFSYVGRPQIGISQGRMRTGAYGGTTRQTYGVLGDEVNTSARLMQQAKPGQVIVSPQIVEATTRLFHFRSLGSIALKGKAEPLSVAEVAGHKDITQRPASTRSMRLLIGREETLAEMHKVLAAVRAGKGKILRIEGPAGIGKSHLAYAFNDQAKQQNVANLLGGCQSTTQANPYYPWRQLFRALFELADSDQPLADQIANVEKRIIAMNPDWELRLPLLGDLLGLPIPENPATAAFDPRLRQELLFTLAVEILQQQSRLQPLHLFIDDAHWMDEASEGLTLALARSITNVPILLTIMHRPPLRDGDSLLPELYELDQHHRIDLGELSPEAVEVLAATRLGAPLAPLATAVIQTQAQGNPFFTEELVETLRESKQLVPVERKEKGLQWELAQHVFESLQNANCLIKQGGEWMLAEEVTLSAADLGVPDSIHGIVLSRLDRLPEDQKLTVKVASVIGRIFELILLKDAYPTQITTSSLSTQISKIVERDFIRVEAPDPRPTYLFKHNTMQEVAYDTLLFAQRRSLHRTIAQWYEENYGPDEDTLEPYYPLLAYHWRYAEDREKERHFAALAAVLAASQFANEDALRYFNRALALTPAADVEGRYRLLFGRVGIHALTGQRENQLADLEHLRELAQQLGDVKRQTDVLLQFAYYYEAISDFAETIKMAKSAIELAEKNDNFHQQIEGYLNWGTALLRRGELEAGKEKFLTALNLSETHDYKTVQAKALRNNGSISFLQHDIASAQSYYEKALEMERLLGDRQGEATSLANFAGVYFQIGDLANSMRLSEEALIIYQKMGDRRGEARILGNLGIIYHHLGEFEQAGSSNLKAITLYENIGDRSGKSLVSYNYSLVLNDIDRFAEAKTYADMALEIDRLTGDRLSEGYSETALALALEGLQELDEAEEAHQHALALRREIKQHESAIDNLAGLTRIAQARQDWESGGRFALEIDAWLEERGINGVEQPIKVYLTLADYWQTTNEFERAQHMLLTARDYLLNRAEKISDPDIQKAYLENVPLHRALLERAADIISA